MDLDKSEIRLIYLDWDGNKQAPLSCGMITTNLIFSPRYAILSYATDNGTATEEIKVNGETVMITTNLFNALQQLRELDMFRDQEPLALWVDAICIDQNDIEERNAQVQTIKLVYGRADRFISWLAPCDTGLDLVRKIALAIEEKQDHPNQPLTDNDFEWWTDYPQYLVLDSHFPSYNTEWNMVAELMQLPYWTTTKTVQHMALASADTHLFFCGDNHISYRELESYVRFIEQIRDEKPQKPDIVPELLWEAITDNMPLIPPTFHLVEELKTCWESGTEGANAMVVKVAQQCSIEDPRDAIYGLLNILPRLDIKPDYTKPVADVYTEWFSNFLLETGGHGGLLAYAGIGYDSSASTHEYTRDLPSWVPDLTNLKHLRSEKVLEMTPDHYRWYQETYISPLQLELKDKEDKENEGKGDTLRIRGVILDKITRVAFPCAGAADEAALRKGLWRFAMDFLADLRTKEDENANGQNKVKAFGAEKKLPPLQAVLAALCRGEVDGPEGVRERFPVQRGHPIAAEFYDVLVAEFAKEKFPEGDLKGIKEVLEINLYGDVEDNATGGSEAAATTPANTPTSATHDDQIPHLRKETSWQRNHALFHTDGERIGAGPPRTFPRDVVCLLDGLDCAVVLRPLHLPSSSWALVGKCYVAGLPPTKEIMEKIARGEKRVVVFNVRK